MPRPRKPQPPDSLRASMTGGHGNGNPPVDFESLFNAYGKAVFGYFLRMGFAEDRSADLTQDVFLRVYKGLEGFRGDASPKTWIFEIARKHRANVLRDERAKKRERIEVPLPEARSDPDGGDSVVADLEDEDSPDIVAELAREGDRERLRAAIDELPPRMRQCLEHYLEDRSYKEIAILVGCKEETVRSQLRQARNRLRTLFGGEP